MARQRMINTKFWSDGWVRTINPLDRYLFMYFLTNDHTNICGIYELPMDTLEHETGLKRNDLESSYFPKLKPKMFYFQGYVILTNFAKNQNITNPSIVVGIQRELDLVPKNVYEKALSFGYKLIENDEKGGSRGVDGLLNLTKPNLTKHVEASASKGGLKATPVRSFNFEDIVNNLSKKENKSDVEKRVLWYIKLKNIKCRNKKEWDKEKVRLMTSATQLTDYTQNELENVVRYLEENNLSYTFETIAKKAKEIIK